MRALFLDVPEDLLRTRRRLGHDRFDEMWEGVLHMVPPPSGTHQRLGSKLLMILGPLAEAAGLIPTNESGFFDPAYPGDGNYRQPDVMVNRPEQWTRRGAEGGAVLAIEIRSPRDESYEKLPFYAAQNAERVMIIEPDTLAFDGYVLTADGYDQVVTMAGGGVFDVGFGGATIESIIDDDQPGVQITTPERSTTIWLSDILPPNR